jgi:DNA-directed RNA polymerase specialized sigma24 family protein
VSGRSKPPAAVAGTEAAGRIARGAELMASRQAAFRRTARRFSLTPEDAEDALGHAVEILLSRAPDLAPGPLTAWMHVVTRREALAIGRSYRRARRATAPAAADPLDPDLLPCRGPAPDELLEHRERVAEAAERLAALKPQERRALALFGAGCSYAEIQAITGWTYTKVNRCMAEGRAALRRLEAERAAA